MTTSLYVHIPFCKRKCIYCDFYSVICDAGLASEYIRTAVARIEGLAGGFSTIYVGGGTPTALDRDPLERLLRALGRKRAGSHSEFTVEANPESINDEKLRILSDCGVNRLSIGVQSFRDRKLKALGRIHSSRAAEDSVMMAARRGFVNLSIDIIFGVWGETAGDWEKDLEKAVSMPVAHISCYALTYEKGTPLFSAVRNGSVNPLEDDAAASMYEFAIDRLAVRGFSQYEISNFAKEGRRCAHNMNYWENGPYVGIGPSAVSYIDGVRSKNIADVGAYIKLSLEGASTAGSSEKLSPEKRARETAALKIRTKDGIDFKWFAEKTGFDLEKFGKKAIADLLEKDLIKYKKTDNVPSGICLKRKGFLFCDTVSSALL
ncbi:MAG: radical SAM family heme chaperone HemW [Candidatus Omnitrophota bacterium]